MDEIGEGRFGDGEQSSQIESDEIKERFQNIFIFLKNKQVWVLFVLLIAIILGVYIRTLPMTDHNGTPGLWDITTNTWTLGPDLDPWLFLRSAKTIVEEGSLPDRDFMRNVPLGFNNLKESQLLPYLIAWTYRIISIFKSDVNVEYAAVIFPVIMFVLTTISFFLFVREVFVRKTKKSILKANLIALISSFFMVVIPVFLPRTIAGIPEKESAAFFFMFLGLYLFLKAWKAKDIRKSVIFGVLSGISSGMMGLIWGGVLYIFIPIGVGTLIAFILDKVKKKHVYAYGSWIVVSFFVMDFFSDKYSLDQMLISISLGLAAITFFVMIVHMIIWNTKISNNKFLRESKIPKTIMSFFIAIIALIVIATVFLGPSFIVEKMKAIHQTLFKPVVGRWNITVAENRQPNFQEWSSNFGPYFNIPFIGNTPLLFWLFFIGSVVLFNKMLLRLRKIDSWVLTGLYVFFFCGIVFSRYSGSSIFNGENFISKAFYYVSTLLFVCSLFYIYIKYYNKGNDSFKKIRFEYLVLFTLFMLTLFTARGAVRLIMVLGTVAPIMVGFLIVESGDKMIRTKRRIWKLLLVIFIILIILSSVYSFWTYYKTVKGQGYGFVPSAYNIQWQKAMEWVRLNTNEDAVFAHWWDYGYWVQSIGNRATITDGGNAISYWNYLMGRLVLTGDNQDDALEFLYNHNATYLLIDSSDIGKYTAFSSIGSDKDFDRYSYFGNFLLDESQTQTNDKNETHLFYIGGVGLDENVIINHNGNELTLPSGSAGVGAIVTPLDNSLGLQKIMQPYVIVVHNNQQYNVNLRYLHIQGEIIDFGSGIEGTAMIFPRLDTEGGNVQLNDRGAAFYISPRLMKGLLSQVYLMDDPLDNFPNFKLTHTESSLIVDDLRNQGMQLPEFVYLNGVRGPIKIWEIEYTGKEEIKEEYQDTNYRNYIDWLL